MPFEYKFSEELEKILKKLKKRDLIIFERVQDKIKEIILNPEHYKPLQNVLAGKRRVHVGSFVLMYKINDKVIIFLTLEHHDNAYN